MYKEKFITKITCSSLPYIKLFMHFIFYLLKSVECTLYDIPVQYKKIVLYKQDFITEIKSPSYAKIVKNI